MLFAPDQDPAFLHDLASEKSAQTVRLERDVKGWVERVSTGKHLGAELSAEEEARLDALGYGGGN
jgi:predicted transcriptional regulator of viral defense system